MIIIWSTILRHLKKKANRFYPQWFRETKLPHTRMEARLYHRKYVSDIKRMSKQEPDKYKEILEIRKIFYEEFSKLD